MTILQKLDRENIWHPYTQTLNSDYNIVITKGKDASLFDENNNEYIDAISSWWVTNHGHSNEYIANKVYNQLLTLEHSIFAGFTHNKAIELSERLKKHLPDDHKKIFFSDNGSTAVEVALKMAIQFWHNKNEKKNKIIAFNNAYHGDTFGAMSVSAKSIFNSPFDDMLFEVEYIDIPYKNDNKKSLKQLRKLIKTNNIAAFIFEPLIQGAGGMNVYEAKKLDELLKECKENNIICIADEVMTGFGRTGKFFAIDYLEFKPDIICLSKSITGGIMPMGLNSCTNEIFDAFTSEDKTKTLFHGHSYTGNPISCTAAIANLDLMELPETQEKIVFINKMHNKFVKKIKSSAKTKSVRVIGTIIAIEIKTNENSNYLNNLRDKIFSFFYERKILLRPLGNIIYILPPYCISEIQLNKIYSTIEEFYCSI